MTAGVRRVVFLVAGLGLASLLLWAFQGLPPFGTGLDAYGARINAAAVPERHVTNAVTAVNFDYRGVDTLGEEYILFAAVTGIVLLLRESRGEKQTSRSIDFDPMERSPTDAVRWLGLGLVGMLDLFGLYIVVHAQLTPGGGFQGGAILGTGSLLAFLVTDYQAYGRVTPHRLLEAAEAVGAGGYALVGLSMLLAGGAFLENLLPLGKTGSLLSAGTIPVINFAVGLEVAAGFALLFREFLKQTQTGWKGRDEV